MTQAKPLPSQYDLRRVFRYVPDTGILYWRVQPSTRVKVGSVASGMAKNGYLRVQWKGRTLKTHRIAWKYMTGEDPVTVDHINRNPLDNRWVNLRDATQKEQNNNRFIRKSTTEDISCMVAVTSNMARKAVSSPKHVNLPPKEALWDLFDYNPDTGDLIRKKASRNGRQKAGTTVATQVKGYFKTRVDGREAYVHRIAWKMMTGEDPLIVDHINRDGKDNRWANLRNVTQSQNLGNTKLSAHNKSGVKGVYWAKDKQKWTAQISIGDKIRYLGRFDRLEDAAVAYQKAATKHFGFSPLSHGVAA